MHRFIILELNRLRFYSGGILATIALVLLLATIGGQILDIQPQELAWVLLPFITLAINGCYIVIFEPVWTQFVFQVNHIRVVRLNFVLLSAFLNGPIGIGLGMIVANSCFQGVILWQVLDIMGFLLHCIRTLSYRTHGFIVAYLLLIPLVYPWALLGLIASNQHMAAWKLITGFWGLTHLVGVFFYQLCFNIGEVET
tara:strand:- start:67 stop:657 length:591 start_codon:yes stop_codon:yes gene_type:complete